MATSVIRKRCYSFATAVRRYTLQPFSTVSPPAPSEQKCPAPKKPSKLASQPKHPRPSTPLSKLGQSRSARHAEAAAQRAAGEPDRQRQEQIKEVRKVKKKKKETPAFEPLTVSRPVHSNLPFAFRYSYTEVPKVQPIEFQEKYSPFGPGRIDRPWDGQEAPPVKTSAAINVKRLVYKRSRLIDSFNPPTKKGIKPVAEPGPFLPGTGPKKAKTREQILGEPLTKQETNMLVRQSMKSEKQLNIGRDGLTHNLLICFYDYWTRERMVRVKCMGVATVDMDNMIFQIEDKTGGKVIHRAGGTLHVFRGRYYNNKDRPFIPRMLWRPHSPIYPKLVTDAPGGLKRQAANALRKRGRELLPVCRLAKNGYYGDLVETVREGFKEDDLVRIDCRAVNRPDYKKIGAKLRDLVPCVVLSFQEDQILLWKGKEWGCEAKEELPAREAGTISSGNNDSMEEQQAVGECTVAPTSGEHRSPSSQPLAAAIDRVGVEDDTDDEDASLAINDETADEDDTSGDEIKFVDETDSEDASLATDNETVGEDDNHYQETVVNDDNTYRT
ncbi:hypothetical protein GOP47_0024584 [Adiantum capillus-veneris]|uniref:CRM domain-containing protein n=1 Tax=Adiantum capillus-veneris TaxID=13818 RepID=A0A9D4U4C0_ADICA|nr:hypothetical protein GOP47_0024584 [Adiantum capillus-veneris]